MAKLFFLLPLFLYFNCHAQAHLGKNKNELIAIAKAAFPQAEINYVTENEASYIQVLNGYENLYYYLEEGICVKFVVLKPYSCNCLETDIEAYRNHCISLGNLKWLSKNQEKLYIMKLKQDSYSLTIVPNTPSEPQYQPTSSF
jgi:hypothetical protein